MAFGRDKITPKCWITVKLVSKLKHNGCGGQTANIKKRNRQYNDIQDNRTVKKRIDAP